MICIITIVVHELGDICVVEGSDVYCLLSLWGTWVSDITIVVTRARKSLFLKEVFCILTTIDTLARNMCFGRT